MQLSGRCAHALTGVCGLVFAVVLATGASQAARPPASPVPAPQGPPRSGPPSTPGAPAAGQATYVGEDTCLTCHADMSRGYHDSAHGRQTDSRTPRAARGCESCHGPGSAHVENPAEHPLVRFKQIEAEQVNAQCLTCHRRGEHALWDGSAHEARDLSCITCHSVHHPQSGGERPRVPASGAGAATGSEGVAARSIGTAQLVARSELELCARCHRDKVVKLDRSGHMPVREGKMTCSTCHNPHGSTNVRGLRAGHSVNEACASCHADKRGPFLWEHAPVTESCTTCHDPHGSANERMLVAKLPMLCQRCHIHTRHPSTIYDAAVIGTSNRLYARSCVTCHSNIHGSNHASGNMFVR